MFICIVELYEQLYLKVCINNIFSFPFCKLRLLYVNWVKLNDNEVYWKCVALCWLWWIVLEIIGVVVEIHIRSVFNKFWRTFFSNYSRHSVKIFIKFSKCWINQNSNLWPKLQLKTFNNNFTSLYILKWIEFDLKSLVVYLTSYR